MQFRPDFFGLWTGVRPRFLSASEIRARVGLSLGSINIYGQHIISHQWTKYIHTLKKQKNIVILHRWILVLVWIKLHLVKKVSQSGNPFPASHPIYIFHLFLHLNICSSASFFLRMVKFVFKKEKANHTSNARSVQDAPALARETATKLTSAHLPLSSRRKNKVENKNCNPIRCLPTCVETCLFIIIMTVGFVFII